eukprot:GSChrysophyteH1.ASY1.ANO1.936.1 assembled CDS
MICTSMRYVQLGCSVSGRKISSIVLSSSCWTVIPRTASTRVGDYLRNPFRMSSSSPQRILNLNDLQGLPQKKRRRWGRGPGSGRGKTSGWGHQKSRSTPRAFEGGQTPLYKRLPKIGFFNSGRLDFQVVNVGTIQRYIDMGRLRPTKGHMITIRNLVEAGVISRPKEGVKLLAKNGSQMKNQIHLEVNGASEAAIKAIEQVGGTVTCIHLNKLAMRAMLKPIKFDVLPRRARPPPKLMDMYLDGSKSGYLSPEIQARNLKLFGQVTSEERLTKEHEDFIKLKRKLLSEKTVKESVA